MGKRVIPLILLKSVLFSPCHFEKRFYAPPVILRSHLFLPVILIEPFVPPCHPGGAARRICSADRRTWRWVEGKILRCAQDDNRRKALRMTEVEVFWMTGADSLSVPCHSEERSDEESYSKYGRCKVRRSFASLRMTGKGTIRMTGGGSVQDDGDGDALDGEREKVRMREEGEQNERQKRAGMAERNLNGRREPVWQKEI